MSRRSPIPLLLAVAALALPVGASAHPLDVNDVDHDRVANANDNCPERYNPRQQDNDGDSQAVTLPDGTTFFVPPGTALSPPPETGGDACDVDDDNDGVGDAPDNCQFVANAGQEDADVDGEGDACDLTPQPVPAPTGLPGYDPDDKTAPRAVLRLRRSFTLEAVRSGLVVPLSCDEACEADAALAVGRRRLGVGEAAIHGAGRTFVFVRYTKGATRRIRKSGRVRAKLSVAVVDASGNRATLSRRITLRR